jgi:pyridoxamine 5'-phosphate oxidase
MEETSERSSAGELDDANADLDPIRQFQRWFDEADSAGLPMVEAMTLATATPEGRPSARMVLLKSVDERGFVFYTNYRSRKAQELEANPRRRSCSLGAA